MANIFMTVVGTGNYEEATYTLGENAQKNRLVQKALLTMLQEQGVTFDRIYVFLTAEAEEGNWKKYIRTDMHDKVLYEDKNGGLKVFLDKRFPTADIQMIPIPNGEKKEDVNKIFDAMYQCMNVGDVVTADVTHGFRILPFLFFPVLQYAKELKQIQVEHLYYGMYKQTKKDEPKQEAPIIDLKQYDAILDWSNAAHSFIRYGDAEEFENLTNEHYQSLEDKQTFGTSHDIAKSLRELTASILTCRGYSSKSDPYCPPERKNDNGIDCKVRHFCQIETKMKQKYQIKFSPFNLLLEHALESIKDFCKGKHTTYEFGMLAAEWCMDRGLIQQAYTALEESIVTFFCEWYAPGHSCADKQLREIIENVITTLEPSDNNGQSEKTIQNRRRFLCTLGQADKLLFIKAMEHIKTYQIKVVRQIKDVRNDINHFGMRGSPVSAEALKRSMRGDPDATDELQRYGLFFRAKSIISNCRARSKTILSDAAAQKKLEKYFGAHFINCSNHPSAQWSETQRTAALAVLGESGKLVDVPFVDVPADADETTVQDMATRVVQEILDKQPAVVMCQGEVGVSFYVVRALQAQGIPVVYACTQRVATETPTADGVCKTSVFQFVRFRRYHTPQQ